MKETKKERFIRVITARVKSVTNGLRLIGNCSNTVNYEYTRTCIERIFDHLTTEMDKAKSRYEGAKDFSFTPQRSDYPNVVLPAFNKQYLRAVAIPDENFPAIEIELLTDDKTEKKVCFVEGNTELEDGEIGVGVYNRNDDDTRYYTVFHEPLNELAEEVKAVKLEWSVVACLISQKITEVLHKKIECVARFDSWDYWTVAFKSYRMTAEEIAVLLDLFALSDEDRKASMPEEGKSDASSIDMSLAQQLLQLATDHVYETSFATDQALYLVNVKRVFD